MLKRSLILTWRVLYNCAFFGTELVNEDRMLDTYSLVLSVAFGFQAFGVQQLFSKTPPPRRT